MNNVLGPLLNTAAEERDLLLETLETYFTAGSMSEAAKRLFCHRNTVRHRLSRIEQLTGRSVDDPLGAVELYNRHPNHAAPTQTPRLADRCITDSRHPGVRSTVG